MKLEAGKYYKTRDGRKAFVAQLPIPFVGSNEERALGYILVHAEGAIDPAVWWADGTRSDFGSNTDLVAEWSELTKGECWINVYRSGLNDLFKSRQAADNDAAGYVPKRIARIRVPYVEGQFDE